MPKHASNGTLSFPFQLPPQNAAESAPQWTGRGFIIGGQRRAILEYSTDLSGWDDSLTAVHEDATAGEHPIDVASRRLALRALSKHLKTTRPTILEVGCSSGYLLKSIRAAFVSATVIGADVVKMPLLRLADELPDVPLLRFDLARCPLPDECVDAVVMLNVLEHIGREDIALRQARRILKPEGILVIEVPAGAHLYDYYDKYLRHYRRYSRHHLVTRCAEAGFDALETSHIGFWLYPAFWLVKKWNRWHQPEKRKPIEKLVSAHISGSGSSFLMTLAMALETYCVERFHVSWPFGIRCTGAFRKSG
jgi:SAM-dependent methyltransferase